MDPKTAMDARRDKLCEFIRAHGLDPNDIPEDFTAELIGGGWRIDRYVRDEAGELAIGLNHEAVREVVTVPYVAPWPL